MANSAVQYTSTIHHVSSSDMILEKAHYKTRVHRHNTQTMTRSIRRGERRTEIILGYTDTLGGGSGGILHKHGNSSQATNRELLAPPPPSSSSPQIIQQ